MDKPNIVYLKDKEIPFKEFCIDWQAQFCWIDGVKYKLPEEWNKVNKCVDNNLKQ